MAQNFAHGSFGYWSKTPRPSIEEQRDLAIEIITDALFDSSLDGIAVVQSPVDTYFRISKPFLGDGSLLSYMKAFNFDCVFVAETLYGEDNLPSQLSVIQEEMYADRRLRYDQGPPRNYRDRLFHYDDSVWLVFLKRDHVLNYRRSHPGSSNVRLLLDEVLSKDLTRAETLASLELDFILNEENMFTLIEDYASFLIDAPSPELVPLFRNGIPPVRRYPELHVPDPENEYVLPPEFLDDLYEILCALTDADAKRAMRVGELRTDPGREVARRVFDRTNKKAVDHLRRDWVRRDKPPPPPPERMDVVFDLHGTVRNEDEYPVPDAKVWVMPRYNEWHAHGISNSEGRFGISSARALPQNLRFLVDAPEYAPTILSMTRNGSLDTDFELTIKSGTPVRFELDFRITKWKSHALEEGVVFVIDPEQRMFVAQIALNQPRSEIVIDPSLLHASGDPMLLLSQEYHLMYMHFPGMFGIDLGRRQIGDSSVEHIVIDESVDVLEGDPCNARLKSLLMFDD